MTSRLAVVVLFFFTCSIAEAQSCYIAAGVGQSSIDMLGSRNIEERLFETEYSDGVYREDRKSTTGEIALGCMLTERLMIELGIFDGFKHKLDTRVTLSYEDQSLDFDVQRVIRAHGYALSAIWEFPVADRKYLYGRIGVAYAVLEGDVLAPGFPYSIHREKSDFVPVIGIGGRYELDDRWSILLEYRAVGHYNVTHVGVSIRYSF